MVLHEIKGAFFSDKFWLPPNTTWEVFEGDNRPHIKDLWWGVPIGVLILIFRVFFERYVSFIHSIIHSFMYAFIQSFVQLFIHSFMATRFVPDVYDFLNKVT